MVENYTIENTFLTSIHNPFQNLLRHPLCLALVRRKWIKYGRYLYYLSLLPYLTFLIFLTSYALLTPNAQIYVEDGRAIEENIQFCQDLGNSTSQNQISDKSTFFHTCQIAIIAISTFNCLMELIQFYRVIFDNKTYSL